MHSNVAVIKLKSNESESAKKKCTFLDYFFFLSILEAGASAFTAVRIGSNRIKNLRKKNIRVYAIFILKFTLNNLEGLTKSPLLLKKTGSHKNSILFFKFL